LNIDPEAYASIARQYPDSISCIFIRKVVGFNLDKEAEVNTAQRFEEAFKGLESSKWFVFEDWSELSGLDIDVGLCRP
jgi:phosphatidate phosphatase APP1